MLGTEFNPLSLPYKKSLWVQLDRALNWGLCGWSRDPEGFDASPSFPTILLFPCHVRNCPSFLAEGRSEVTYEKNLELGRGKIIRYPFFQVVESSESINRLWKLRVCSEDLSSQILAGYHPRNSLEAPFLIFGLIFTVAFLSSFSFSAILSATIGHLDNPFFYLDLTEGWLIFVVKPKCKCLAATMISWLRVLDQGRKRMECICYIYFELPNNGLKYRSLI